MAIPSIEKHRRRYGLGVLLVLIGGAMLSTNGILVRHIEQADGWQILFYRGVGFSITMFLILVLKYRGGTAEAFRAIGKPGLWAGLALGLASCFYVFALLLTTVANAMFIIGAAPLATAFAAWLVLNERTTGIGLVSMLVALCGICLLVADGLAAGHWLGNVMAFGVVVGFVVYLLILRGNPATDMLPAICLSGLVMATIGLIGADDLTIPRRDLWIVLIMGCLLITAGFMCYTIATRYILAAEVALFALAESILAPIWVWIGVGEQPSAMALTGIVVVLLSVAVYGVVEVARAKRALGVPT